MEPTSTEVNDKNGKKDWKRFLQEEWIKLLFGIIATTIGFFLALYFNSLVEKSKERALYNSMTRVVYNETKNNLGNIAAYGFISHRNNQLVYPDFDTKNSDQMLLDKIFLTYAPSDLCDKISISNWTLKFLDKYKSLSEKFKIQPELNKMYSDTLHKSFDTLITESNIRLNEVLKEMDSLYNYSYNKGY